MENYKKNICFIILIFLFLIGIFFLNYFTDPMEVRCSNKYFLYWSHTRKFLNLKLKSTKNQTYDTLILGTSITSDLYPQPDRYNMPRIILFEMSSKDMYDIIKTFYTLHKEAKNIMLPLEIHTVLFDHNEGISDIAEYDYTDGFSFSEFIQAYCTFEVTKKSLDIYSEKVKKIFSDKNEFEVVWKGDNPTIVVMSECRIAPPKLAKLSQSKIKDDLYYWGKIIDFLQENNINITCFIPPANYIYLQDAMTTDKVKVFNDLKQLIVSKGVEIYDFSKKNKYNEESLKTSYLFSDLVHPNFIYGNVIYKILTHRMDDKSLYRVITADNIEDCNRLSAKELAEYRETHKDYIEEYYTYEYGVSWDNINFRKFTPLNETPAEYRELYEL